MVRIWGCFTAHWWAAFHRKDVLVYFTINCCFIQNSRRRLLSWTNGCSDDIIVSVESKRRIGIGEWRLEIEGACLKIQNMRSFEAES